MNRPHGAYAFRLCFEFSGKGILESDKEHIEFYSGDPIRKLKLSAGYKGSKIDQAQRFVISGREFANAEEASRYADAAREALLLYGVRHRIGVDLGRHRPRQFSISQNYKEVLARQLATAKVIEDHLGITIYMTDPMPTFVGIKGEGRVSTKVQVFLDHFANELGHVQLRSDNADTGVELYGLSHFVGRAPARFLLLFASLEALLQPMPRSEAALTHVDRLIDLTRQCTLDQHEKQAFLSQLGYLRVTSIAQGGKDLAMKLLGGRMYNGLAPADFFSSLYRIRNDLVHRGNVDANELHGVLGEADRFVSDILQHHFARDA